jgi:hypothetical protein
MKEAKGLIKKHDFVDDRTRDAVCLDMAVFMQDSVHPTLSLARNSGEQCQRL